MEQWRNEMSAAIRAHGLDGWSCTSDRMVVTHVLVLLSYIQMSGLSDWDCTSDRVGVSYVLCC